MYIYYLVVGIAALLMLVGLWYRLAAIVYFLGLAQIFFIDCTHYLNHMYLIVLIAGVMVFIPANHSYSLDVYRHPTLRENTAKCWTLWLLRFLIGLPCFYGGLAKINTDWPTDPDSVPIQPNYFQKI